MRVNPLYLMHIAILSACDKSTESYAYLKDDEKAVLESTYTVGDTLRFTLTKNQNTDTLVYVVTGKDFSYVSGTPIETEHTYHYEQLEVQLSCLSKIQPITLAIGVRSYDISTSGYDETRYFYLDTREEYYQYPLAYIDTAKTAIYAFELSGHYVPNNHKADVQYSPKQGLLDLADINLDFRYTKID